MSVLLTCKIRRARAADLAMAGMYACRLAEICMVGSVRTQLVACYASHAALTSNMLCERRGMESWASMSLSSSSGKDTNFSLLR